MIRAYTPGIISTTKGCVMEQEPRCVREFKVRHKQSDAAKGAESDCGLRRKCAISVSAAEFMAVSVRRWIFVQGRMTEFIAALNDSQSTVLEYSHIRLSLSSGGGG